MAVEPIVRRNWPDSLVSWARLTAGRYRDPLVASHVLAGLFAAEAYAHVGVPLVQSVATDPNDTLVSKLIALSGVFVQLGVASTLIWIGICVGLLVLVLAVIMRFVVRRLVLADALAGFLANGLLALATGGWRYGLGWGAVESLLLPSLACMIWLWMLRRFGFLAMLTFWTAVCLLLHLPLRFTGWVAARTIPFQLIPIALAAWALWVILSDERKRSPELSSSPGF